MQKTRSENLIVSETIKSCLIGGAISLLFFFLVFHGSAVISLGEGSKFALDFIPQTLGVGFFAAFPPVLMLNQKVKKGTIDGQLRSVPKILLRAVALGVMAVTFFGLTSFFMFSNLVGQEISFITAGIIKVLFGGLVASIVTSFAARYVLERDLLARDSSAA